MLTYVFVGSLLYILFLINLPLLPNRSSGITHVKAMRGLLLIPIIGYLMYLAIFRSLNVGTDYEMYYNFYVNGEYTEKFDLFIVLIYDFARNEGNFLFFTFIITSLFLLFNLLAIKKITYNFFVSFTIFVLSFYFFFVFNGMRQAVAIAVVFSAVYFVQKEQMRMRDFLAFILLIFVAAQFHVSAIFMFPLLFLRFFKVNRATIVIVFLLTVMGYFTPFIKNNIGYSLAVIDFYAQKYENDLDFFFLVNKEKGILQFMPVIIQYLFLYYSFNLKKPESVYEKFLTSYYLAFLFLYSASGVEAVDRIQYYFYPSIILFYDYLIHSIYTTREIEQSGKKVNMNRMVVLASISFWFLYFILRVNQGIGGIKPYNFMS
ncbi:EpsG family protein [Planococcus glaciei]|uniref:EpsG family protein n=1 Tax=Planococcus glaciei TaxID=459472 RepID=UPI000885BA19|nr:EpsG family protein [Planococcus glaciei]SDI33682.1 EpsG family protein [Planococcus glaciei]